jgi:hypothetical protein
MPLKGVRILLLSFTLSYRYQLCACGWQWRREEHNTEVALPLLRAQPGVCVCSINFGGRYTLVWYDALSIGDGKRSILRACNNTLLAVNHVSRCTDTSPT